MARQLDLETILKLDDARFEVPQNVGGPDGRQHIGVGTGPFGYHVSIHLSFIPDTIILERHIILVLRRKRRIL